MEGGVTPGRGASFELVEYLLAEALPLIVGMDTHAHDFGTRVFLKINADGNLYANFS